LRATVPGLAQLPLLLNLIAQLRVECFAEIEFQQLNFSKN